MPTTIEIPLTSYRISASKPAQKWGSPAALPIASVAHRALLSVPIDKVPQDGTITSAILRVFAERADANGGNFSIAPPSAAWNSSVTWTGQPAVGAVLDTADPAALADRQAIDFDVTAWAVTRSRNGLRIASSTAAPSGLYLAGSSHSEDQPLLIVEYVTEPEQPGNLIPNGGSVSVASPILTYAGDDNMTLQRIEYSNDGIAVSYDSGWVAATSGYFDPALVAGAEPVLADGGAGVYWRATTDGPDGQSVPSEYAYYEYDAFPAVTITNPGATTSDGTPLLQWTVASQTAFKAEFWSGTQLIDGTGWVNETATRDWTPTKAIKVPGGTGRFILYVQPGGASPRVASVGAPANIKTIHDFTTVLAGAGAAVNTVVYNYTEPLVTITGTRVAGIPDYVMLVRDGVAVPLWAPDGAVYPDWAPGADFFVGQAFTLPDYTSNPREEHTWEVRVKVAGVISAGGPTVTETPLVQSVWVMDPRDGSKIELFGYNGLPVVDQETGEQSILHTPINGGLLVEPKRRRIIRTTRAGSLTGAVVGADEADLERWVLDDSGLKYRLIFGKVNWSVILGDYSPEDVFYPDPCGPDMIRVACNWWQRLTDV